jgi:hypothetical protein
MNQTPTSTGGHKTRPYKACLEETEEINFKIKILDLI